MLTIGSTASLRLRDLIIIMVLGLILTDLAYLPTVVRTIGWASPEWSLILVLYLAARSNFTAAAVTAFFLGSFQDALTISPEGLEALALELIVIIVAFGSEYLKVNNFLLVILVTLASLLKNTIFIPGLLRVMNLYMGLSAVILFDCLLKALMTGLVAIPTLAILDFLTKSRTDQP
ncbi:MAG: rod shape-determining protein MreD [Deltaproteobacteria bacterium]|nr:rod shape-determining protein MreD [Deltaproteobacteria bacterium]